MIVNGIIVDTFLGLENGLYTIRITFDTGSLIVNVGNIKLAQTVKEASLSLMPLYIPTLLDVLKVKQYENLIGTYVRLDIPDDPNNRITKIGHIIHDKWIDLKDYARGIKDAGDS